VWPHGFKKKNFQNFENWKSFKPVWKVLKSLKTIILDVLGISNNKKKQLKNCPKIPPHLCFFAIYDFFRKYLKF